MYLVVRAVPFLRHYLGFLGYLVGLEHLGIPCHPEVQSHHGLPVVRSRLEHPLVLKIHQHQVHHVVLGTLGGHLIQEYHWVP